MGHRHSILVREIDNFDEVVRITDSIAGTNGMIDIGTSTIGARLANRNYTDAIIDRLNIDNGNTYHTEECKAHERKLAKSDCENVNV